jgi:hypothetical protein
MRPAPAILLALALACGCKSTAGKDASTTPGMKDWDTELFKSLDAPVGADFKGASLEVILSHLSDRTSCNMALDPRLCWAHGPAEFRTEIRTLNDVLAALQESTPEARMELWRGVVFVSKAGEPLLIPQTPLTSSDWPLSARNVKVTVNLIHTPFDEVVSFIEHAWGAGNYSGSHRSEFKTDESIKDRQVTAWFHDLPLDRAIDVVCRLTDTKFVESFDKSSSTVVYTFKPRELAAPAPR